MATGKDAGPGPRGPDATAHAPRHSPSTSDNGDNQVPETVVPRSGLVMQASRLPAASSKGISRPDYGPPPPRSRQETRPVFVQRGKKWIPVESSECPLRPGPWFALDWKPGKFPGFPPRRPATQPHRRSLSPFPRGEGKSLPPAACIEAGRFPAAAELFPPRQAHQLAGRYGPDGQGGDALRKR